MAASGISNPTQKRALVLHLAGPKVRDIFNNSIPADARGEAKDYQKAMDCPSEHFKPRKNAPMARQAFIATNLATGETINNFITCLQKLAEHCEYESERDNQVRDRAIFFIQDKNLKSKLHREGTLTLQKLMEIVSQYHDKEALVLIPENRIDRLSTETESVVHVTTNAESVALCDVTPNRAKDESQDAVQVVVEERIEEDTNANAQETLKRDFSFAKHFIC